MRSRLDNPGESHLRMEYVRETEEENGSDEDDISRVDGPIPIDTFTLEPITQVEGPVVVTSDGHLYGEKNITEWLKSNKTSPNTGVEIKNNPLYPGNFIVEKLKKCSEVHENLLNQVFLETQKRIKQQQEVENLKKQNESLRERNLTLVLRSQQLENSSAEGKFAVSQSKEIDTIGGISKEIRVKTRELYGYIFASTHFARKTKKYEEKFLTERERFTEEILQIEENFKKKHADFQNHLQILNEKIKTASLFVSSGEDSSLQEMQELTKKWADERQEYTNQLYKRHEEMKNTLMPLQTEWKKVNDRKKPFYDNINKWNEDLSRLRQKEIQELALYHQKQQLKRLVLSEHLGGAKGNIKEPARRLPEFPRLRVDIRQESHTEHTFDERPIALSSAPTFNSNDEKKRLPFQLTQQAQDLLNSNLFKAIEAGDNIDKIKDLVKQGANVDQLDEKRGYTPLVAELIAGCTRTNVVIYLLDQGANANVRIKSLQIDSFSNITPLMIVVGKKELTKEERYSLVNTLLKHGALPNISSGGNTALHWLAHFNWGTLPQFQSLLLYGANPTLKNKMGKTPRQIIMHYHKSSEIIKLLQNAEKNYRPNQRPPAINPESLQSHPIKSDKGKKSSSFLGRFFGYFEVDEKDVGYSNKQRVTSNL